MVCYTIDIRSFTQPEEASGGYCDFLPIKNYPELGFKSFRTKEKARNALNNQKLLSKFDLAPEILTPVCKLPFDDIDMTTNWGFVTERATIINYDKVKKSYLSDIQKLVDKIHKKTKLKILGLP